ncbi:MAG: Smr/MutS family protein [Hyphomicrobiales bacterium]|nr:Smr/MutS family protein [Hyphomicrobiales bacterium]
MTKMDARRSGLRDLTIEELELWRFVTANIRPWRKLPHAPTSPKTAMTAAHRQPVSVGRNQQVHRPAPAAIHPMVKRKLKKGRLEIDARLDLHGYRLAEAHVHLAAFLTQAQARGARTVLIVTGKGKGAGDGEVGPLKRQTPMWLSDPRLRHLVAAFGEADRTHGGAGALYVQLRRGGGR